jgi:hypothetical protein
MSDTARKIILFYLNLFVACFVCSAWSSAQSNKSVGDGEFHGRPALVLANDIIELKVLPHGGAMVSLALRDDAEKMSPLWDSFAADEEAGRPVRDGGSVGHFVCVDGFGAPSPEERSAGLPGHGEAHTLPWVTRSAVREGKATKLTMAVQLPRVREVFTRTFEIVDGENVVYVRSTLENLLAFDRPVCWTEHATIGTPFLERGVTVVDLSRNRALARPYDEAALRRGRQPRRLQSDEEFEWPMAPGIGGEQIDLRSPPAETDSLDLTGHLMTGPAYAFATALHPKKKLLFGYVFKPSESPWLQNWESYPPSGMMARGLEFGTQAFGLPRRTVVTANRLFGELLYRWLPARSTVESSFLMFWTRTPAGFKGVSEIDFAGGELRIEDHRSGQMIRLPASRGL